VSSDVIQIKLVFFQEMRFSMFAQSIKSALSGVRVASSLKGTRRVPGAILGIVVLGATVAASGGIAPPAYTLTDLGTLPGTTSSSASAINNAGQVVGSSGPSGSTQAFLYTGGQMQSIPGLGTNSAAVGINSSGVVIGLSAGQSFVYSGGSPQFINVPTGGGPFQAAAINDRGQIAGWYSGPTPGPITQAGIYSQGSVQSLNLAQVLNYALGINSSGEVIGAQAEGPSSSAFIYSNGTYQEVPPLGSGPRGPNIAPSAINDAGQVVGSSETPVPADPASTATHAFLYSSGATEDLGTLSGEEGNSNALGINNPGEVVGSAFKVGYATLRGFLFLDGTMYDLNDLTLGAPGYVITSAVAINDSGQIAADAFTPSGQEHAVLLTPSAAPLPPAAWTGLGTIAIVAGGLVSRRRFARN
jgi:probable HAF family extracellular repeat protein